MKFPELEGQGGRGGLRHVHGGMERQSVQKSSSCTTREIITTSHGFSPHQREGGNTSGVGGCDKRRGPVRVIA